MESLHDDLCMSTSTSHLTSTSTPAHQMTPTVSVTKTLTRLLAIPANRSCADCKAVLIDASQVHASYSPNLAAGAQVRPTESSAARPAPFNHFRRNHAAFAPPKEARPQQQQQQQQQPPTSLSPNVTPLFDLPVDPAIAAASQHIVGHGVFVCTLCGAAHKQLSASTAITKAVMDITSWTIEDVQLLSTAGGNARATAVLEAYIPAGLDRPISVSTIAERLTFIRAKYEALAFVLPPSGPLAARAWQNIVHYHPEWVGLWGVTDLRSLSGLELREALSSDGSTLNAEMIRKVNRKTFAELPNRLVDHFCVVTASDYLQPTAILQDLSKTLGPEDFLLTPLVSECFPTEGGSDFPDHISTFVFPDGCRPSSSALPPSYFSIGLTNAAGERLYGGVLRLYDDNRETLETMTAILTNSDYPKSRWPRWLIPPGSSTIYNRSQSLSSTPVSSDTLGAKSKVAQASSAERLAPLGTTSDVMFLPKCLVILSHYPFFDLWRKFLLQLYRIALTEAPLPIERFVANFVCEVPLPPPGKLQVKFGFTAKDTWTIERPPENQLPLVNFSYLPLFACLSVSNVLVVMGCLLQETRVVILTKHYPLLSPVCEALLSLLFPLYWQGMYLPILPYHMLEILDAPVPFLVGLHARYLTDVPLDRRPQGVVIVDLDRDEVHLGYRDDEMSPRSVPALPERHASKLKTMLLESASSAYVVPNNQRSGFISCGVGNEIPLGERDVYAQTSGTEASNHSGLRRRDILPHTDKAYNDNELLVPLSGFLSEHGYLSQREASGEFKEKKGIFQFGRPLRKSSSFDSLTPENSIFNVLDMLEPSGFSASSIREAFLRFFTSLFQTYKTFIDGKEFRSSEFTASLNISNANSATFVRDVVESQMFQGFIDEATEQQKSPTVLFFDASINAKINRSKKVVLTGRKKETSFLKDKRSVVTEVFTPPPPSNFGLPDDGRFYHYATFPTLNPQLFGKIRRPMQWEQHKIPSLRRVNRRGSQEAWANEQAVVEKASRSSMSRGTKRGGRNLETALKALSVPFNPSPVKTPSDARGQRSTGISRERSFRSTFSELTLPSTLNITPEMVSSAEEIVLNARRKQAILLCIIVKLQGYCRMYLVRRRRRQVARDKSCTSEQSAGRHFKIRASAINIQRWIRLNFARAQFARIRRAAIVLQAYRRGFVIRTSFQILIATVTNVQAVYRGHASRELLSVISVARLQTYKLVIFSLWCQAATPLSYRTKFWSFLTSSRPMCLILAEQELQRLWNELKIEFQVYSENGEHSNDFHFWIGKQFGLSNAVYWKARQVSEAPFVGMSPPRKVRKNVNTNDMVADRVLAERTQIYEKLSIWPVDKTDSLSTFFNRFSIPLREKKKKVALAAATWSKFDYADHSVELMLEIFPELQKSTDILFIHPSKKALRRFSPSEPIPRPLHSTMQAHRIMDDRIRKNVAEIADISLRIVPSYMCGCRKHGKLRPENASSRFMSALMKSHDISDAVSGRGFVVRHTLFHGTRREHLDKGSPSKAKVPVISSADKRSNAKGMPNSGGKVGKVEQALSFPDLLVPTLSQGANETFWVRQ